MDKGGERELLPTAVRDSKKYEGGVTPDSYRGLRLVKRLFYTQTGGVNLEGKGITNKFDTLRGRGDHFSSSYPRVAPAVIEKFDPLSGVFN